MKAWKNERRYESRALQTRIQSEHRMLVIGHTFFQQSCIAQPNDVGRISETSYNLIAMAALPTSVKLAAFVHWTEASRNHSYPGVTPTRKDLLDTSANGGIPRALFDTRNAQMSRTGSEHNETTNPSCARLLLNASMHGECKYIGASWRTACLANRCHEDDTKCKAKHCDG